MKTAVLFDLDGTLVDSARGIAAALSAVAISRGGAEVPLEQVRGLVARGANALIREGLGDLGGDVTEDLLEFRAILRKIPNDPTTIFPGVSLMLAVLKDRYPLGIVTNKPEHLARILLQDVGLDQQFAAIVGGDTTPLPKPHPEPVLHALERMGHTGPAILVGDSNVDAGAAAAAGVRFVLFNGGYDPAGCSESQVHGRFDHFGELPDLLATLADADTATTALESLARPRRT